MAKRSTKTATPSDPPARAAGKGSKPAGTEPGVRRKLVAFDGETWHAVDLLGKDTFMTFQELADEAFRDLLRKHGRPVELRDQLKHSLRKPDEKRRPTEE